MEESLVPNTDQFDVVWAWVKAINGTPGTKKITDHLKLGQSTFTRFQQSLWLFVCGVKKQPHELLIVINMQS